MRVLVLCIVCAASAFVLAEDDVVESSSKTRRKTLNAAGASKAKTIALSNEAYTDEERAFNDYMKSVHDTRPTSRTRKRKKKRKKRQGNDASETLPIEIRSTERMGRGVYALRDVAPGDVLASVPIGDVVCMKTLQKSEHAEIFENIESSTDALALYLLLEKYKGTESRFASWFPLMPTSFESPPFFTESELELLRGDPLHHKAMDAKRTYMRAFENMRDNVIAKHSELFDDACCSYEEYAWARHMIESRAWHLRGKQYLVPMADFFNHRPHPSQKRSDYVPDVRGEFFERHHRITDCCAVVVADRSAKRGEQVFETYGDNSNFIYFMYHGFIPDENPYECVDFTLPDLFDVPPSSDSERRHMIDAVSALGLRSRRYCVKSGSYDVVTSFMRVRHMSGRPKIVEGCVEAMNRREDANGAWSPNLLKRCVPDVANGSASLFSPLFEVTKELLDAYPTSLDEDLVSMEQGEASGMSNRERWARRYVIERKKILRGLIEFAAAESHHTGVVHDAEL